MFSPFIPNQTFFSLLHISFAIHPDFRNWHHFFYDRSGSNKIHALPILIHFGIKNSLNQTAIFSSSNKCNFHIDQIKERLVKRQIKMLGIYGIGKKKLNRTRTTLTEDMIVFMIYDYYLI